MTAVRLLESAETGNAIPVLAQGTRTVWNLPRIVAWIWPWVVRPPTSVTKADLLCRRWETSLFAGIGESNPRRFPVPKPESKR